MTESVSQVALALRWYLTVQAFGLAALPLCLRLFRHLPDRGYGVSKPAGLLLAGWVFWILCTLGWLHNTAGGILLALVIVVVAGLALYLSNRPPDPSPGHLPWRAILLAEVVFALAFAAWCVVRAYMPRIETAGGEKWMEIAFLRAILRSDTFPPHDPWLSGYAISYYYFGYVIVAMITRLAGILPSIAFNLGIATLFALTCTGAFSLTYNLVAAVRGSADKEDAPAGRAKWSGVLSGLLGPLLVALTGNLEGLMEVLYARGIGSEAFWQWVDIRSLTQQPLPFAGGSWVPTRFYWWWQASRVVRDYSPLGSHVEVIDEFPAFSFLLGDMHPHVLGLPFVLLAIALALNLYLRASEAAGRQTANCGLRITNLRFAICGLQIWEFLVYALCLGGLGFLNTWDFPIYLFVVAAAYAFAHLHVMRDRNALRFYVLRSALLFISLLVLGFILYQPFWRGFQSQVGGIVPNLLSGTRLPQFLLMFGPLLFIAAVFIAVQARWVGVRAGGVIQWTLLVTVGIVGVLALLLGSAAFLVRLGVIEPQGPAAHYVDAWMRGEPLPELGNEVPGLLTFVRLRVLIDPEMLGPSPDMSDWKIVGRAALASPVWVALGLIVLLVTTIFVLKRVVRDGQSLVGVSGFVLLLFVAGLLLVLGVEFVYIKDHFGTRMNTVFKFYFQAWILWGIGGAYALVTFIRRGGIGSAVAATVAALLIFAGLIYPVLAIPQRAGEYGGPPTLDGAAYLGADRPADYAAIAWLNEQVGDAPVILETPGGGYTYEGRVSAHTGLPTVLGWAGHESQWRGAYDEQARQEDIERLYTSVDATEVLTLLDKYDIRYVYVGPLERDLYPVEGLVKFAGMMEVVYDSGDVVIYER